MKESTDDREKYLESLNLTIDTVNDIENLLVEFEEGRFSRKEYMACMFISHSITRSREFSVGYSNKENIK